MFSISSEFTDFQRCIINILSYVQVSLTTVEKGEHGKYSLIRSGWIRTLLYILVASNTFFKFAYLVLLVLGYFGPLEFLDKMSALLWALMCMEILQELCFWYKTYPLFEVLASLWKLENKIYHNLGKPTDLLKKSNATHRYTLILHTLILVVGCILIGGQFVSAPKYAVYTYSAFKRDNTFLLVIFTLHEVCFMWQAWTCYLSVVTISSINAVEMTSTLNAMTQQLIALKPKSNLDAQELNKEFIIIPRTSEIVDLELGNVDQFQKHGVLEHPKKTSSQQLMGSHNYNIDALLSDYKKLQLTSELLNDWCSHRIVAVHCIGYCQFISDVFMMIQILRLTDLDIATVMWYGEDATACLYMIFRMFSLMAEVAPASENFMRELQHYLSFESPGRKKLIKVSRALRLVSLKLGSCPVRPGTVGTAVMMLLNYYLCVAIWK